MISNSYSHKSNQNQSVTQKKKKQMSNVEGGLHEEKGATSFPSDN